MTGPDYLLAAAEVAAGEDQPFARSFGILLTHTLMPDDPAFQPTQAVAKRPLQAEWATPTEIVRAAYAMAEHEGDGRAMEEVVALGTRLLATWPGFVAATPAGWPPRRAVG
jgi:hypothetical protein